VAADDGILAPASATAAIAAIPPSPASPASTAASSAPASAQVAILATAASSAPAAGDEYWHEESEGEDEDADSDDKEVETKGRAVAQEGQQEQALIVENAQKNIPQLPPPPIPRNTPVNVVGLSFDDDIIREQISTKTVTAETFFMILVMVILLIAEIRANNIWNVKNDKVSYLCDEYTAFWLLKALLSINNTTTKAYIATTKADGEELMSHIKTTAISLMYRLTTQLKTSMSSAVKALNGGTEIINDDSISYPYPPISDVRNNLLGGGIKPAAISVLRTVVAAMAVIKVTCYYPSFFLFTKTICLHHHYIINKQHNRSMRRLK